VADGTGKESDIQMNKVENRRHPREAVYVRIVIQFRGHAGERVETNATIEDRSESGVGVYIQRSLTARAPVTIIQKEGSRVGMVRRCVRTNAGFFVGIEL
jgi:hypothetical protein